MRKKLVAIILVGIMSLTLTACGSPANGGSTETASRGGGTETDSKEAGTGWSGDTIEIGLISMITGDNPLNGERMNQGVQLAVDQFNEEGGIDGHQINLTILDDQTTQDMAVTCANKLISQGVCGIIGPHRSTNAMAVEAVIEAGGVPTFTGGTSPKISELGDQYLFRCRASDSIFAEAAVAYAVNKLGSQKIGMLFNNDDFGTGAEGVIKAYCEKNGVDYVEQGHNTGDKDFTAQLMQMKSDGADTLIIWTHDAELAINARQIYELGLDVKVVSSPGVTMNQVIDICEPEYIEGWYGITDYVSSSDDPAVQEFKNAFMEAYGIEPELYAASYYGATVILLEAIKAAGTDDPTAIMEQVKKTKDLTLPNGTASCDDVNDLIHNVNVAKIVNKEVVFEEAISVE